MKRSRRSRSVITIIAACTAVIGWAPAAVAGPPSGADLSITISDSPDPVNEGAEVTYTVSVSNAGPAAASDVWVQTLVYYGATFVRGTSSQGTCYGSGGSADCSLGSLAKRGSASLTLVFRAGGNDLTATSYVSGGQTDPKSDNNQATSTTGVLVDQTPPKTLATCGAVAPNDCRSPQFELAFQRTVRVTAQPSAGFTGTLAVILGGTRVIDGIYVAGKLVSGKAEDVLTLYPGVHEMVVTTSRRIVVHGGGPKTIGIPFTSCWHIGPYNSVCPPSYTVEDVPPVIVATPSVGPYQATVTG